MPPSRLIGAEKKSKAPIERPYSLSYDAMAPRGPPPSLHREPVLITSQNKAAVAPDPLRGWKKPRKT